jgi:hypothetical protein
LNGVAIKALVVDPVNSSTLYAATGNLGLGGGVFKSTDGGATWAVTNLKGMSVYALAVDPNNSSRIYAGAYDDTDAFIARGATADGSINYLSYLGERGRDQATSAGVDEAGSIYVTGQTFSYGFPIKDAWQPEKNNGPFATSIFITTLKAPGFNLEFSTFLGGLEPGSGAAIAADESGRVYVAGSIGTPAIVPSLNSTVQARFGVDAFAAKLASPPSITTVSISGKKLIVTGEGFDRGAVVLINLQEQATKNDESQPSRILVAKKAGKKIAPGEKVLIHVLNKDGLLSLHFEFIRR